MTEPRFGKPPRGGGPVLLAGENDDTMAAWRAALIEAGFGIEIATADHEAVAVLNRIAPSVIVLDLERIARSPFVVTDYAAFRAPSTPLIVITRGSFGADGALFDLIPTARAILGPSVAVPDLVALIEHHARAAPAGLSRTSEPEWSDPSRSGREAPASRGRD